MYKVLMIVKKLDLSWVLNIDVNRLFIKKQGWLKHSNESTY